MSHPVTRICVYSKFEYIYSLYVSYRNLGGKKKKKGMEKKHQIPTSKAGYRTWPPEAPASNSGPPPVGHALLQQGANRPSTEAVKGLSVFRK